ncbi:hypothetical protein NM75689_2101 [Neisseria meningitidis 75689]|nr:hypothetical protein NM75689_2101 [Neisseria meningitidis 75689]
MVLWWSVICGVCQVGAYLFGTEFAADKGVDVLNQLRIELIGLSLTLFDSLALPLGFFGAVLLPLGAVPSDFAADGAFVAVKLFGDFGDGAVAGRYWMWYRSPWVSCV